MSTCLRVVLVGTVLLGAAVALGQGGTPLSERPGWIAYTYVRGNDTTAEIWLVHPDGSEAHRIAADLSGEQLLPNWSPDGERIVFTTRGIDGEPLYEYDLATNTSRQLFVCESPCAGDDEPAYSPDGTRVAFVRAFGPFVDSAAFDDVVPSSCGLWIGEIATGEVTQVTDNAECHREYVPRWSPDGTRLAYWRVPYEGGRATSLSVHLLDLESLSEQRLTEPEMFAAEPDWSPDGEWLVFNTYPYYEFDCCKVSNLYRIRPDGSGLEQLTFFDSSVLRAVQPRYTPDGEWILFAAVTTGARSLWAIPADGGDPFEILHGGFYTHASWQP